MIGENSWKFSCTERRMRDNTREVSDNASFPRYLSGSFKFI